MRIELDELLVENGSTAVKAKELDVRSSMQGERAADDAAANIPSD